MDAFTRYAGICKGFVVDIDDPAGLNRIKIRVPMIHGFANKESYGPVAERTKNMTYTPDNELPWAYVCFPFGNTTPPEVNQVVWVIFNNGNGNYPVVIGWAGYEYTSEEEILEAQ